MLCVSRKKVKFEHPLTEAMSPADRPVFTLRPLSAADWGEVQDSAAGGVGQYESTILKRGLVAVVRLQAAEGNVYEWSAEEPANKFNTTLTTILDNLDPGVRSDIAMEILRISQLSGDERKNSLSPSSGGLPDTAAEKKPDSKTE